MSGALDGWRGLLMAVLYELIHLQQVRRVVDVSDLNCIDIDFDEDPELTRKPLAGNDNV